MSTALGDWNSSTSSPRRRRKFHVIATSPRSAVAGLIVVVVAVVSACFLEPESGVRAGPYPLSRVQGKPPPAVFDGTFTVDGALTTIEALDGRLILYPDRTFEREWAFLRRLKRRAG